MERPLSSGGAFCRLVSLGLGFGARLAALGLLDAVAQVHRSGVAGAVSMLAPSQEVFVVFENADPTLPRVIGYSLANGLPLTATYDAKTLLAIGPTAAAIQVAGGVVPVALATPLTTFLDALKTWSVAVAGALSTAGFPIAGPQATLVTAITTAEAATPAKKVTAA